MTLSTDVLKFLTFYFESCTPDLKKLANGDQTVVFPESLGKTLAVIQDVMTQLRGVVLEYPNKIQPDIKRFYCITTCDSYAEKAWFALLDEKSKNHAHILVLRFDVPGETYENKSVQYHDRYAKVPSVPQAVLDMEFPFKDGEKMPAPLESIFKNRGMREKLMNYLLMYLLKNFERLVNLNSAIIIDGILLNHSTMASIGFSPGDAFHEVSRNPIVIRKVSDDQGIYNLRVASLDHQEFVCHVGEADLGVVYWMEHFKGNSIICAKDGDLLWVFLMYLDNHPDFEHAIFLRKQMPIGNQCIDNPDWEPGSKSASGRSKSKTKTIVTKTPMYFDMQLMYRNICSKEWYTLNSSESTDELLARFRFTPDTMKKYSPQIHPVPLLMALFCLCGNDYNSSFYRSGCQKILGLFAGNPEIFRHLVCKSAHTVKFSKRDAMKHCCPDDLESMDEDMNVVVSRYGIVYSVFKRVVFEVIAEKKLQKTGYSEQALAVALDNLQEKMNKAKLKEYHTYSLPTEDSLKAICGRTAWTLFYFAYGGHKFSHILVPDPLETDSEGLSIYGWEKDTTIDPIPGVSPNLPNVAASDLRQTCKFSVCSASRDIYWSHY